MQFVCSTLLAVLVLQPSTSLPPVALTSAVTLLPKLFAVPFLFPLGVWRASAAGGNGPISYGSVEADPVSVNPGRAKEMVKTRTRSAQDVTMPRPVDIQNGAVQIPVLVTNGASVAQT
jgi:hypothetical protein